MDTISASKINVTSHKNGQLTPAPHGPEEPSVPPAYAEWVSYTNLVGTKDNNGENGGELISPPAPSQCLHII